MRNSIWLLGAVLLSACGPAGILSGKVTVEGGNAGGVAVIVYGPQSAATVTGDDGAFSVGSLPDGKYVVRATVRGADVEEVSAATTITQGKASPDVILAFRASTAKVTGKVVMADGSDSGNLTVTATGPEIAGARTAADGSFSFEGLKTGAYTISVEAKDTREGRVAVGVNASGTIDAGELRLTPVGRFGGSVSYNAMAAAGVTVTLSGTSFSAVTDTTGRFQFDAVPTGMFSVNVHLGTSPFFRSATAMLTVLRGANPDVMLSLTDDAPKTGTVTGVVTFHGPRSPRDITVAVPGSNVTTTPQVNGAFSLTLPVGVWDVVASAPQHPSRVLGRVTVLEGAVQALPGQELSWYRPIWRSNSTISGPGTVSFGSAQADTVAWTAVSFADSSSPRLALVNASTGEFRIVAAGPVAGVRISKNGKYAGWYVNGTAFVYEIGTAVMTTFAAQPLIQTIEFSSDESALFIQRAGTAAGTSTLTRFKFAMINAPETFPPTGNATAIYMGTVDRWFVRDSTNDIRLVTPVHDVPQVFTQVSTFSVTPTAWATTACAATCFLYVLSPTSETAAVKDTSVTPAPGALVNFGTGAPVGTLDNRADYPCFASGGTTAFCVKSADGSHYPLPAIPTAFKLNEDGGRVIYTFATATNVNVREETMPPSPGTSNLGSNLLAVGWTIGWISPTRAYAYENTGSPRAMHLVKAGVDTLDSDIGGPTSPIRVNGPLLVVPQSSTSRWRAYVGDGVMRSIDVATTIPVSATAARPLGTGPVTKYAAVSFDQVSAYILDEAAAAVRQTSVGYAGPLTTRSGSVEYTQLVRPGGGSAAFYVFNTGVLLEYSEGSSAITTQIGQIGVAAWLGLAEDQRTIVMGSFVP